MKHNFNLSIRVLTVPLSLVGGGGLKLFEKSELAVCTVPLSLVGGGGLKL